MPAFAVLAFVLCCAAVGAAQEIPQSPAAAFVGKTIVEVHLVSEGRPTDDAQLLELLETKPGESLAVSEVRESITHFFSLGRFQDVQVQATAVPGGVSLRYDLVPMHTVSRVDFRGRLGASEGDIRTAMEDRFGATPPVGRAADVADLLMHQFYPDRGYMRASVKWSPVVVHDPDRTFLTFDIDAGPRAKIRNVTVEGEPPDGAESLKRQVGATEGAPYEPGELRSRLAQYEQRLRKKGRYEARAAFTPAVSEDATSVDLRLDVQPGPAVKVVFRGDPLPEDRIKDLVPVEREGSIDQDLLEDSARRITDYLAEQGYWKASVQTSRQEEPGTVTIAFTIVRGLRYYIAPAGASITGNRQVPIEELRPTLQGLQPGDVYVAARLGAAVDAIAGIYRTRGFASLKIDAAANELPPTAAGHGQVQPAIVIVEGPQTFVGAITFEGNQHLSSQELAGVVTSVSGGAYYEPRIESDRRQVQLAYFNAGFNSADVVVKTQVSPDGTRADLRFQIQEGPQTVVDHVIIVGNTRTDPRIIQRELLLKPGQPLGLEDRLESQRRLAALGLFRRIRIEELAHGTQTRRDVLVTVEEAAATAVAYGGGVEMTRRLRATGPNGEAEEHLEFAPRGFFDIWRRNIAGKNRSVNLYTRVSVRPKDVPDDPARDGTGIGFSEYRVVGTYREPRALGMRAADLTVTGALEQGVRSSFNFARKGANAEISRGIGRGMRVSGRYSFSTTRTFDERLSEEEQVTIDRIFPQVRLSSFAGAVSYDTRDDVVEPSRGMFLSAESTFASRALGGQVGFIKSFTQGFWFRTVPGMQRTVLATRLSLGLADGFPRVVTSTNPDGSEKTETIEELPGRERFFAGGDSTIRGYALDTVGAPNTISERGFPKGGNAVIILNAELRVPVWKDFGGALFVDGGNVFNRVTEFDFGELRGGYGFGLRYRSPVGPIRVDLGFKMDRRPGERPREIHFSIGQAF